jgi:nicotinamidase/pyrazinamidase
MIGPGDALLIIDVQNDFCPGGTLAVASGDEVVEPLNELIRDFDGRFLPIVKTRDWHPARTKHFADFGGKWPPHCVQGTRGAKFRSDLLHPTATIVISKGLGDEDDYSGFDGVDLDNNNLSLEQTLREQGVNRVIVGGLATDYCVKYSVLDARAKGFEVVVVSDAIRGVENPGGTERAISEMEAAGATFV